VIGVGDGKSDTSRGLAPSPFHRIRDGTPGQGSQTKENNEDKNTREDPLGRGAHLDDSSE
jgi:hypothetical protein